MSLYNSERYLREAIDSVLSQTLTDFEFIIVDDGSKDGSADIIRTYHDSRIRLISQENAGLPTALNKGIRATKSDLIARMDPDDLCSPERLARQYDYLLHHQETMIVGTTATCINEKGNKLADIRMLPFYAVGELALPESPCIHPSVMFRRLAFERAGGYPEEMRYGGEDAVLFNKMLSFGAISNIPEPLMLYRLSYSSMSHKSRKFNRLLRQRVVKEVHGEQVLETEKEALAKEYKRSASRSFGYHLYIGKLFFASSDQAAKARTYFFKALRANPLSVYTWTCLVSSYMPSGWRVSLKYCLNRLKRKCG